MLLKSKKVVCIGGGHGLLTIAKALKSLGIKADYIVTVFDDGGSTGILRKIYNIPAIGDIRKLISELAENPVGKILNEKLGKEFYDHKVGNLVLLCYIKKYGFLEGIKQACKDFKVFGKVIPVSECNSYLFALTDRGIIIKGESKIEKNEFGKIYEIWLEPEAYISKEAEKAIKEADIIFIGPGSLFGSVLCNFCVLGINEALVESNAKVFFFVNISKDKEIFGYNTAQDIVDMAKKYVKKVDFWVVNNKILFKEHIEPKVNEKNVIFCDLADEKEYNRHSPEKLARFISEILEGKL